ncbi:MAG: (deoxy)nucleoside triphosphate pyrophosphohydrolase [bacterium]|nr:(deoxy)nucleoside triphosphate pyrophosphohydrolase [bacterium]
MAANGVIVVAGIIVEDGNVLIGQRKRTQRHPLKWEFPGGKVELGETPRAALKRELQEELAIQATVGREIVRYEYSYPRRRPALLIFYRVKAFRGTASNVVFKQIKWVPPTKLPDYDFLDGDIDFIRRLVRGEYRTIAELPGITPQ